MRTSVDVHNFLLERDVPHELVPTRGRLRSAERAAAVLGLPPEQVGHVELYEDQECLVAALVPSGRTADADRVAAAAGRLEVRRLPQSRATDLSGFLHEALPPVALPSGTMTLIDQALADEDVLYFAGGETSSLLKIRSADLVRAAEARVVRLTG